MSQGSAGVPSRRKKRRLGRVGRAARGVVLALVAVFVAYGALLLIARPSWVSASFEPRLAPFPDSRADAQNVLAKKALRSPERVAEIRAQQNDIFSPFWALAGFDKGMCPRQVVFAHRVYHDLDLHLFRLKLDRDRIRPAQVLPEIDPVIEVPWHQSYPSGHATQSEALYLLFASWYPERTEEFKALAHRIAENREVAGVHYPSDSAAGQSLADQVFAEYLKSPDFLEHLRRPCLPGGVSLGDKPVGFGEWMADIGYALVMKSRMEGFWLAAKWGYDSRMVEDPLVKARQRATRQGRQVVGAPRSGRPPSPTALETGGGAGYNGPTRPIEAPGAV